MLLVLGLILVAIRNLGEKFCLVCARTSGARRLSVCMPAWRSGSSHDDARAREGLLKRLHSLPRHDGDALVHEERRLLPQDGSQRDGRHDGIAHGPPRRTDALMSEPVPVVEAVPLVLSHEGHDAQRPQVATMLSSAGKSTWTTHLNAPPLFAC